MSDEADILPFPVRTDETPSTDDAPPLLREALGETLREERHRQGRTLHDVAEEAFVSVAHLSDLERGRKEGSSEVLESITRALGVEVAEVLEQTADRLRLRMGGYGHVLALAA